MKIKKNHKSYNNIFNSKLLQLINLLNYKLKQLNYYSAINLELEGFYELDTMIKPANLYNSFNDKLTKLGIKAKLKSEFWQNQWEYESNFNISNINKIITDYENFLANIDKIFAPAQPIIKPVIYNWQQLKFNLHKNYPRPIHVPNAIQLNISLWQNGKNLCAQENYLNFLQNLLIDNSINNLVFFLPNQAALDRLLIKEQYNLQDKLMSPDDISGGNQGSIAAYLKLNKKNKPNNMPINLENITYQIAPNQANWQKNARIEFRLASSSYDYNLNLHISFILIIILESIIRYDKNRLYSCNEKKYALPKKFSDINDDNIIARYKKANFFAQKNEFFMQNLADADEIIAIMNLIKNDLASIII